MEEETLGGCRHRLHAQCQQTDREMSQANPDAHRIATGGREMEKAMKKWQKQYRGMGSESGISQ